jgi:hypothetical protein
MAHRCDTAWLTDAACRASQNRFNQGIDGLPTISTQTAEQCADACNADKYCELAAAGMSIGCLLAAWRSSRQAC